MTGPEGAETRTPAETRWLIVNADDFGASDGVSRGIVEAHTHGVVTSTSLMVTMPAAVAACAMARDHPDLSLGLHIDLTGEGTPAPVDLDDLAACQVEVTSQLERFEQLVGRHPTHLDAHHNIHRRPSLAPIFVEIAGREGLPMREHGSVRYFPDFYGQWDDGETHPDWIGVDNLIRMLDEDIGPGVTELSCHPGYVDPALTSAYHHERELELSTLINPRVREHIDRSDLGLIGYRDLPAIIGTARS